MSLPRFPRLLLLICIISLISHVAYSVKTEQYPVWDEHHYLDLAIQQYDILTNKGPLGFVEILTIPTHRQPLYSWLITTSLLITGTKHTYFNALLINGLLIVSSIIGVFCLTSKLYSSRMGLIAALLYATYGNVLFYNHFSYSETATTTLVIWSLIGLYKTQGFLLPKWSLIAGILTGLAFLTRWIAPTFLIGALLVQGGYGLSQLLATPKSNKTRIWKQFAVSLLFFAIPVILIPIVFFFSTNLHLFLDYVQKNQGLGASWVKQYRDPALANTSSLRSIMFYFNILQQNTIIPFSLFILGFLTNIRFIIFHKLEKTKRFESLFLLASFIAPYVFLTFITIWKEDRFIVPIYPVMAIISVTFFHQLHQHKNKKVILFTNFLIVLVIGISIFNAIGAQWGLGPMGQKGLVDYITPRWLPHPRRFYLTPLVWPPTKDKTNAEAFLTFLQHDWKQPTKARVQINVAHEPLFNAMYARTSYETRFAKVTTATGPADYLITIIKPEASQSAIFSAPIPALDDVGFIYRQL